MASVRDAMTPAVLTVGPGHSLREAAALMADKNVGSAIVSDSDAPAPGIITERDLMRAVAANIDLDTSSVGQHHQDELTFAQPNWTLEQAAEAMLNGGFRHLIVVEGDEIVGILSMRDIARGWLGRLQTSDD